MSTAKGTLIGVVNNPNSITEVYYDAGTGKVQECKHLDSNRTKWYEYPADTYLERFKGFAIENALRKQLL